MSVLATLLISASALGQNEAGIMAPAGTPAGKQVSASQADQNTAVEGDEILSCPVLFNGVVFAYAGDPDTALADGAAILQANGVATEQEISDPKSAPPVGPRPPPDRQHRQIAGPTGPVAVRVLLTL